MLAMGLVFIHERNFEHVKNIATNSPLFPDFPDVFSGKNRILTWHSTLQSGSISLTSNISDPSCQNQSQKENRERTGRSGGTVCEYCYNWSSNRMAQCSCVLQRKTEMSEYVWILGHLIRLSKENITISLPWAPYPISVTLFVCL